MESGKEIVCFKESKIFNIKYAHGERPSKFFQIKHSRVILFCHLSKKNAEIAHSRQSFNKINSLFGYAVLLFDNIDDAQKENPNGETTMGCDVKMNNVYELKNAETLQSCNAHHKHYKIVIGKKQNHLYYMILDPRLISNVHYCGGKAWNHK